MIRKRGKPSNRFVQIADLEYQEVGCRTCRVSHARYGVVGTIRRYEDYTNLTAYPRISWVLAHGLTFGTRHEAEQALLLLWHTEKM